jgi:hypothetical protein
VHWSGDQLNTYWITGVSIACGNGAWVELGGSQVGISTDGLHWTEVNVASGNDYYKAVSFANNMWVGAGGDYGNVITSIDGATWNMVRTDNSGSSQGLNGIAYGNGRWVIVGWGGSAGGAGTVSAGVILVSTSSTIQ